MGARVQRARGNPGECAPMVPRVAATLRYPLLAFAHRPLSFSQSLCCFTHPTTHRHYSAIHLGPVLLITRLGLRTRIGDIEVPSRRSVPLKRRRYAGGGLVAPPRRPLVLSSSLGFRRRPSPRLFLSPFRLRALSVSVSRANDGFFCYRSATKGPLYGAGARGYFTHRMLFNAHGVTRVARAFRVSLPRRAPVISPFARFPPVQTLRDAAIVYACLAAGRARWRERKRNCISPLILRAAETTPERRRRKSERARERLIKTRVARSAYKEQNRHSFSGNLGATRALAYSVSCCCACTLAAATRMRTGHVKSRFGYFWARRFDGYLFQFRRLPSFSGKTLARSA